MKLQLDSNSAKPLHRQAEDLLGVMSNARNRMSFSQEMHSQGMEVQNFELHISRKIPPKEAIDFFNAPEDARMLCLERLRGRPCLPFVYFVSYFNPAIPMSGEKDLAAPLYETLNRDYGIVVKTSREQIYARSANAELAEKPEIAEVDPVLVRKRFVLDVDDVPVEYNTGYCRPELSLALHARQHPACVAVERRPHRV